MLAQSNFLDLDPTDPGQVYWESIYKRDIWKDPEIEARFADRVDRYGRREWNGKDRAYMGHALGYMLRHPLHFLRNYGVKVYNVLRYPLADDGRRWFPFHVYRLALILLGLAGLGGFIVAERHRSQWVMVPIFVYFLGFSALMHIVRSGRITLPVKLLLTREEEFFTKLKEVQAENRDVLVLQTVRRVFAASLKRICG